MTRPDPTSEPAAAAERWWNRPALRADPKTPEEALLFLHELEQWLPRMDARDRCAMMERLAVAVPHAAAALPALIRGLEDLDTYDANDGDPYGGAYPVSVQDQAAAALSRVGGAAVPALVEALQHPNPRCREGAGKALECLGPAAAPAIPALVERLSDPDNWVNLRARWALGRIIAEEPARAEPLVEALEARKSTVRLRALEVIGDLPEDTRQALMPRVVPLLDDPVPAVRVKAAEVIHFLAATGRPVPGAVEPLLRRAGDAESEMRRHAIAVLGILGLSGTSEP